MPRLVNEKAYKPSIVNPIREIKLTIMLDAVPGAWHQIEDFLKWACSHAYVQSAETIGDSDAPPETH
jgi:hypothetical protein